MNYRLSFNLNFSVSRTTKKPVFLFVTQRSLRRNHQNARTKNLARVLNFTFSYNFKATNPYNLNNLFTLFQSCKECEALEKSDPCSGKCPGICRKEDQKKKKKAQKQKKKKRKEEKAAKKAEKQKNKENKEKPNKGDKPKKNKKDKGEKPSETPSE